MADIQIKLDGFEGPLDLLLHLIKKLEIDIYDIPIAEITDQYLAYLHTMQTLELDIASEYMVMAATLMAIKSKLLLPKQEMPTDEEDDEENIDPREALVEQLLNYRKFKQAAHVLHEKEAARQQFYSKEPEDLSELQEKVPLAPLEVNSIDLFMAFHDMLHKLAKQKPMHTTIATDEITIEEKIVAIKKQLREIGPTKQGVRFSSLFTQINRGEVVTTFMALLELMKAGDVSAEQSASYGEILLFPSETVIHPVEEV